VTAPTSQTCPECDRLHRQAGVALLTGDTSRLKDVRRFQQQHLAESHDAPLLHITRQKET
jgi:transposase